MGLTLYGAKYSVYVRIVRLILSAKRIPYHLQEVDIFAAGQPSADYLVLNPMGRIPTLIDGDFVLYETRAIAEYLEERAPETPLMPTDHQARARCRQLCSVLDNDCYVQMVWGVFVPESDNRDDRQAIAPALAKSKTIMQVVQEFLGDSGYFSLHSSPGLTDYWALPMFDCFDLSPSGRKMLADHPALHAWLVRMRDNADDLDRDILATAV